MELTPFLLENLIFKKNSKIKTKIESVNEHLYDEQVVHPKVIFLEVNIDIVLPRARVHENEAKTT